MLAPPVVSEQAPYVVPCSALASAILLISRAGSSNLSSLVERHGRRAYSAESWVPDGSNRTTPVPNLVFSCYSMFFGIEEGQKALAAPHSILCIARKLPFAQLSNGAWIV